jgi:pimeloyl-ACP methyl ester carboxylesterase
MGRNLAVGRIALKNGVTIAYHEWGSGMPVVALHAITYYGLMWEFLAERLKTGFRIIAPDLRGHGDTDASRAIGYRALDYATDVIEMADALHIEQFSLMGDSLGTRTALVAAAKWPRRVSKIVAMGGPHGFSFRVTCDMIERLRGYRKAIEDHPRGFGSENEFQEYVKNHVKDEIGARHYFQHNTTRDREGRWRSKYSVSAIIETLDYSCESLMDTAKSIRCPCLMLMGAAKPDDLPHDILEQDVKPLFANAYWQEWHGKRRYHQGAELKQLAVLISGFLQN